MALKKLPKILISMVCVILALCIIVFCFIKFVYIDTSLIEIVKVYSKKYNVDSYLIFCIIKAESNFNRTAVSKKGAEGLMQILPSTAVFIGESIGEKEFDLTQAETNIKFGCFYLNYLSKNFDNIENVILSYNAGIGAVNDWLKNKKYSSDGKTVDNIPFAESREYLRKIKYFQKSLKFYQL